jgi:hypothetical protein
VDPVEHLLGKALNRLAGVCLFAVALVALVAPRDPNLTYSRWRVSVCLAVLLLGALVVRVGRGRWLMRRGDRELRRLSVLVTVGGTAVCTLLAWALRYDAGWDARVVAEMSHRLVGGHDLTAYQYGYLSRYPNNLPLLVVDNLCGTVGGVLHLAPGTVSVLLNGLGLAVTLQATHWLVAMLRGPSRGIAAQLLVLALVGLSPWMSVAYTDLVSMPLVTLATALVVAAPRARSRGLGTAYALLAAGCLLLAYVVKTTPVVSVVAVVLVAVLAWRSTSSAARRTVAVGLLAGLALFAGGAVVAKQVLPVAAGVSAERIDRSRTPPTVWWVYMATTQHAVDGHMRYGGYDTDIVRATRQLDRKASARYAQAGLERRLADLGPTGYAAFLANKAAWNWGDGMFWAWGEGDDANEPALVHGPLTDAVRTWNHPAGDWYAWRAALAEAVWLLLLLTTGLRLLRARWSRDTGLLVLSVLGIAAFTLVFQGRSRYLLTYVPLVVALWAVLRPAGWRPGRPRTRTAGHAEPATAGRAG